MSFIINPGSQIVASGVGWTNTEAKAREKAGEWLGRMLADGIDVEMLPDTSFEDGRWDFCFQHKLTGVQVHLGIDGIDDLDAYKKDAIFSPRVYWNGSSSSEPCHEDFVTEGFMIRTEIVRIG